MPQREIQLSLKLQPKDIEKTAKQTQKQIESMFSAKSGEQLDKNTSKILSKFDKLYTKSVKLTEKLQEYQAVLNKSSGQGLATKPMQELLDQEDALTEKLKELKTLQDQVLKSSGGNEYDSRYIQVATQVENLNQELNGVIEKQIALQDSGKAFVDISDKVDKAKVELNGVNNAIELLNRSMDESGSSANRNLGDALYKNLSKIGGIVNKADAAMTRFNRSLISLAKSSVIRPINAIKTAIRGAGDSADKTGNQFLKMGKRILMAIIGVRGLYMLVRKIKSAVVEALQNMAQFNGGANDVNRSMSMLITSLAYLKASWGAAFAPIITAVAPILSRLMNMLAGVANTIAIFMSVLTGKSTYMKAVKNWKDYAKSVSGATGASKKAEKADKKQKKSKEELGEAVEDLTAGLASFDELNAIYIDMTENMDDMELPNVEDMLDDGGGGGAGLEKLFEEAKVPKGWWDDFLRPLKKAWDEVGDYVISSWKYALRSVKNLLRDIGRDFLQMWNQKATIQMFKDILHIIGDIGMVVGHLARNLNYAWNVDSTGLHIWESLRDILATIIKHIRKMSEATVKWADKLNFEPLLKSILGWLQSINRMADGVWTILEKFYTKAILPFSKFMVEEGLPNLFEIFEKFNKSINWDKLIKSFSALFDVLSDFGKLVWNNLLIFIEEFLMPIGKWTMNVAIPQLVDSLTSLAKRVDWNKITKSLRNTWKNLSKFTVGIAQGLIDVIDALAPTVIKGIAKALELLSGNLGTIIGVIIGLTSAIKVFKSAVSLLTVLKTVKELAVAFGASGLANSVTLLGTKIAALAGPVGIAVAAIAAIGTVIAVSSAEAKAKLEELRATASQEWETYQIEQYGHTLRSVIEASNEVVNSLRDRAEASKDLTENAGVKETALAQGLLERYTELKRAYDETGIESDELRMVSERLCEIYPELNSYINEETGYLQAQPEIIQQIIDKELERYKLQAFGEAYAESIVREQDAKRELENQSNSLAEAERNLADAQRMLDYAEQIAQVSALKERYDALKMGLLDFADGSVLDYEKELADTNAKLQESLKELGITVDDLPNSYSQAADRVKIEAEKVRLANEEMTDIGNITEKLKTEMESAISDSKYYAKQMGQSIGDNLSEGAGEGLKNKFGDKGYLKKNAYDPFNDGYKELWGINSPSKVTEREWGEPMADGVAQGWKNKVESILNAFRVFKTSATSVFTQLQSSVISIFSSMVAKIQSLIAGLSNAVSSAFASISNTLSKIGDAINAAKDKISNSNLGNMLSGLKVPGLAKGAVIPANREFLAVLGDQRSGVNIETPLSTMIDAFNTALDSRGGGSNEALQRQMVTLLQQLVDKDLVVDNNAMFRTVRNQGRIYQKSTGSEPFVYS